MRTIQLYNVFGLLTERVMLEVPLGLHERGIDIEFAAESFDAQALQVDATIRQIGRVMVEPTADVPAQMQAVAAEKPSVNGDFDLVHGHFGPRLLHAVRWARRGIPTVVSCYGYDTSRLLRDPCWGERYRWAAESGVTFVALSAAMRQALLDVGVPPGRCRVIPLGIELDRWQFAPRPPASPRFLFVGRFVPKKGLTTLLHAMAALSSAGVDAALDVIGSGDDSMASLVSELNLADRVHLHGLVPYEQLGDWMRRATALVAPSQIAPDGDAEGCPMVLMQAQACGCPVITTHHSGNPEAVPPEGQQFVVPEQNPAALAAAMRSLIELAPESREALVLAGRSWIEQRFDFAKTLEAYAVLYRELTPS